MAMIATTFSVMSLAARETIHYSPADLKTDTAIAVYFEGPQDDKNPLLVFENGALQQMVGCKVTLASRTPKVVAIARQHPEYKGRKVVSVACVRTDRDPQ